MPLFYYNIQNKKYKSLPKWVYSYFVLSVTLSSWVGISWVITLDSHEMYKVYADVSSSYKGGA
jgi:hypothetical protein